MPALPRCVRPICGFALLALLAGALPASARVIHVTTLALDAVLSECELDEAILNANEDTENFLCDGGQGADVIRFSVQGTIFVDPANKGPLPAIEGDLTIEGPGADLLTIDGNGLARVLTVAPGASLTLIGVTIAGGLAPAGEVGGGLQILAGGDVTLRDCVFDANAASGGGAVSVTQGTLRVERCTFVGNDATGGATGAGGAIRNDRGQLAIVNSTFSDNTAGAGAGGAVSTLGAGASTRIHSSSFVANATTGNGGTIARDASGSVSLTHTLIAESAGGPNCGTPAPTSEGYNLSDDASCNLVATGDLQGVLDAGVGPLADNGGPTDTHGLEPASVAIDAGAVFCFEPDGVTALATDQRGPGFPRPSNGDGVFGASCDIGAIEVPEPGAGGASVAALALATLARRRASRRP